jgi:hypothetical protein
MLKIQILNSQKYGINDFPNLSSPVGNFNLSPFFTHYKNNEK